MILGVPLPRPQAPHPPAGEGKYTFDYLVTSVAKCGQGSNQAWTRVCAWWTTSKAKTAPAKNRPPPRAK